MLLTNFFIDEHVGTKVHGASSHDSGFILQREQILERYEHFKDESRQVSPM